MSVLIGVVGKAGAGKDTVANYLVQEHDFVRVSFSGKLKQIVSYVYGMPLEIMDDREQRLLPHSRLNLAATGPEDKVDLYNRAKVVMEEVFCTDRYNDEICRIFVDQIPENCTPRLALQLVGTEGFRKIREAVWVDYLVRDIQGRLNAGQDVVVSDVRFPNELEMLCEIGGVCIGVTRDNLVESYNHVSENHIDGLLMECDYLFANNGTIHQLEMCVVAILAEMYQTSLARRLKYESLLRTKLQNRVAILERLNPSLECLESEHIASV